MSEVKFIEGVRVFKPHENAPDFVKLNIIIDVDRATEFFKEHQIDGEIRMDLKKSKGGNLYLDLNEFRKKDNPDKDSWGKEKTTDEINRELDSEELF